jgi:hypothetical protein
VRLQRIAYGKPRQVKEIPVVADRLGNVGVRLFQVLRARPYAVGYKRGKK